MNASFSLPHPDSQSESRNRSTVICTYLLRISARLTGVVLCVLILVPLVTVSFVLVSQRKSHSCLASGHALVHHYNIIYSL
ncbi:unnamed protein product [Protopolystoma xenopodis]|uniref:Uncharacterized protein n=1 Tax=Protopolystoma xenopodis TaxID=117903 RepID=A0A448XRX5_9PLAT|nr:unnamed protein product [Protopolystoma xenopodis]